MFLGKLIETEVNPHIPDHIATEVRVETALTVAAMQIAANGVGIAWVPSSMLDTLSAPRTLVSYSDILPTPRIATTATRLIGQKSKAEERIWAELAPDVPVSAPQL